VVKLGPAYLTLGMLAQMATGAVFFQEFRNFSSRAHAAAFGFSLLLEIVLVCFMAKSAEVAEPPSVDPSIWPDDDQPTVTKSVSVAGFSGAIECLERQQSVRKSRCLRLSCCRP